MPELGMAVQPMDIGAEITGLTPGAEKDPAVAKVLYDAWLEYGILLFRNIDSQEWHLSISQVFGELEVHPYPEIRCKEDNRLVEIGGKNRGPAFSYDGGEPLIQRIPWHRDTAYTPAICKGAMLRMVQVASEGGETMLCDTARAYDELPPDMKARLDDMEYRASLRLSNVAQTRPGAFWSQCRQATPEEDPEGGMSVDEALAARYPSVIHPVVITHPESGRKCIFLSPTYLDFFIGMEEADSQQLLEEICDHMLQPRFVHVHKWSVNDAFVWDNRRFMHAAMGCSMTERRRAFRTTLAGPMHTGRFFDASLRTAELPKVSDL